MSTFLRLVITVTAFAAIAACDDDKPKSAYAPARTCDDECGNTNPGVVSGSASSSNSSGDGDADDSDQSGFDEPFFGSSGSSAGSSGSGSFGISGVAGAGIPEPSAGTGGAGGS